MLRYFLTSATDFAKDFNNAVNRQLSDGENLGIKGLREEIEGSGGSLIKLLITVGLIAATISLIVAGLKISSRNVRTRDEGKQKMVAVIFGAAALMGLTAIVLLVQGIATNFMK